MCFGNMQAYDSLMKAFVEHNKVIFQNICWKIFWIQWCLSNCKSLVGQAFSDAIFPEILYV